MGVFTARFIYQGFSFGEAAWASQIVYSWQTTVVGDPLYRPFGKSPEMLHTVLEKSHNKLVEWSYLRLVDLNLANNKSYANVATMLEELPTTKESAVLTEKLGDLYANLGKPSSCVHAYSQALQLETTPQQRIRLRLALGEKLIALERNAETYEDYQKLLQESPDYPDKLAIYNKLATLARKLDKTAEAEKYEAEVRRLTAPVPPAP
jgi:tetratricopeptide (TPR) repeat protein